MRSIAAQPHLEDVFQPILAVNEGTQRHLLDLVAEIEDLSRAFDWLLSRHHRQEGMSGRGSAEAQTMLLAALIGEEAEAVYDPVAGSGGFLLALWRSASEGRKPRLFGQELNLSTSRIARQRFLIENASLALALGDSLTADAWPDLRVDVVVADPPYAVKRDWPTVLADEGRWGRARAPGTVDLAWLLHCARHLRKDGRAYVFLPNGSLFRDGAEADLRRSLLEEGLIEAVVSLPPHSALGTVLPITLWILRSPEAGAESGPVLLIDGGVAKAELGKSYIEHLGTALRDWRVKQAVPGSDRSFSNSVEVLDLTSGSVNMVPSRWIHRELTVAQREEQEGELVKVVAAVREAREGLLPPAVELMPAPAAVEWAPIKTLAAEGLVDFVKGVPIKSSERVEDGLPLLRTRDLTKRAWERWEPVYVDPRQLGRVPELTRPGDIVLSPGSGTLRARVDEDGGNLLQRPLQALRIGSDFIQPVVAAAFLESARNHRFVTGSAYARVSLPDLELPLLDREHAEALWVAFEELHRQERLAGQLMAGSERLRELLVSLGSSLSGREAEDG